MCCFFCCSDASGRANIIRKLEARYREDQPAQTIHSTVPRVKKPRRGVLNSEAQSSRLANRQLTCGFEGNHIKNLSTLLKNTSQNSTSHISLSTYVETDENEDLFRNFLNFLQKNFINSHRFNKQKQKLFKNKNVSC